MPGVDEAPEGVSDGHGTSASNPLTVKALLLAVVVGVGVSAMNISFGLKAGWTQVSLNCFAVEQVRHKQSNSRLLLSLVAEMKFAPEPLCIAGVNWVDGRKKPKSRWEKVV